MQSDASVSVWQRISIATGKLGGAAFLLIFFAASLDQGFDWRVFLLSGAALFLVWIHSNMLVPIHLRNERAERDMWDRYEARDWKFVEAVGDLTGAELDELRGVFKRANDAKVRQWIRTRLDWLDDDDKDMNRFLRFFDEHFIDNVDIFFDEDGRLSRID